VDGFFRRGIQRARLPLVGALDLARGLGKDFLHDTGRVRLVLSASLNLDGCSHRRAKGENTENVSRIGHAPTATQQDNGTGLANSGNKPGCYGGSNTGVGRDYDTRELHRTTYQTLA